MDDTFNYVQVIIIGLLAFSAGIFAHGLLILAIEEFIKNENYKSEYEDEDPKTEHGRIDSVRRVAFDLRGSVNNGIQRGDKE
jgi:hypothetical protein